MSVEELMKTLVDEIATLARTETVIGETMTLGEHTVVPISRVSLGFGGGSGEGEGGEAGKGTGRGHGGGGGGGIRVEPAAFIVVRGEELSVLAAPGRRSALGDLFEHVPELIAKIASAQGKGKEGGSEGAAAADEGAAPGSASKPGAGPGAGS